MRQQPGLHRGREERRAAFALCLEPLERRDLLSAQPPLIADATPYSTAFVSGIFRDVLGRPADSGSLNWLVNFLDQGQPVRNLATALVYSNEYAAHTVQAAYQQYLGREADAADVGFWVNVLQSGVTDEQLAAAMVASDEFYAHAGGNNAAWIQAAYQSILGRPASNSDIGWGLYQLGLGVSRFSLADSVAMSMEHEQQIVRADFTHYLHTTYSDAWYTNWASQLSSRQTTDETMIVGMLCTNAYYEEQTGVPPTIVPVPSLIPGWAARFGQIQATAAEGKSPIVFLGDSITQGWQLVGQPVWSQYFAPLNSLDAGIVGDTTENVLWRIEHGQFNGLSPKVVVLMVGVNDFAAGDSPQEVADGVAADVAALRQQLPDTRIMVLSILPAVLTTPPLNLMAPILATDNLLTGLNDAPHVFYVNLWPFFTNPDGSSKTELHVSDGLHLNQAGYTVLAQTIAPELNQLLVGP